MILPSPQQKILTVKQFSEFRNDLQNVVFTNGCFDIIHAGHIDYLSKARNLGEVLVVGLNSDESVRRLKGPQRPINDVDARSKVLASLFFVDYVIVFEEDTPLNLIKSVRPDILVKGGDYTRDTVVGADFVESYGGKVVIMPLLKGYSTTSILNKNGCK
ncbi:MAG: D-glycero-beta-D-manno-heptose 1-phosphate adenylyltransferase [Bacteroidales bacterium]|nr:D-glycero-beta-D-manno-heptose 1-phosphate adenylyltransferase [Bacteroidales bacterium]